MPTEHLPQVDLRDLVHVLQQAHILCLPCIASALTIESSEVVVLMRRLRHQVVVKEISAACPSCATTAPLFALT